MIPIRDENPSGSFPIITLLIIVVNVLAYVAELSFGLEQAITTYGLVPARVWAIGGEGFGGGAWALLAFFAAMFMHGPPLHIIGNMWFLWLFGDNIEDRLGHRGFLFFYLACGIVASIAHVLFVGGQSEVPMIGASGAIAGVLGAYLICFPRARVLTVIPVFIFFWFLRLPAFIFLVVWFAAQVLGALSPDPEGVAWLAHVGGFAAGCLLVIVWPKHGRSRQSRYQAVPDVWRARRRG